MKRISVKKKRFDDLIEWVTFDQARCPTNKKWQLCRGLVSVVEDSDVKKYCYPCWKKWLGYEIQD